MSTELQRGVFGWLSAWLLLIPAPGASELTADHLDFAPLEARHDPLARYALPFPVRIPRMLSQGVDGEKTHKGIEHYSFDFLLPTGTEVLAARAGRVALVVDGHAPVGVYQPVPGNKVLVLHDDGTFGMYIHLSKGITVKEGERVAPGRLLAHSGNTGYSDAPHLHFAVAVRTEDGFQTVPIRFQDGSITGFVPKERDFYGARPPSRIEIRIDIEGRTIPPGEVVPLRRRQKAQIRVYVPRPGKEPLDVTTQKRLSFSSMTPWSLAVDDSGVVTAGPMPGYEDFEALAEGAEIYVVYGKPGRRFFAQRQLPFEIVE